jgi:hypothetical protein
MDNLSQLQDERKHLANKCKELDAKRDGGVFSDEARSEFSASKERIIVMPIVILLSVTIMQRDPAESFLLLIDNVHSLPNSASQSRSFLTKKEA